VKTSLSNRSWVTTGVAALLLAATGAVYADFINLPVKWSQPIVTGTNGVVQLFDLSSDSTLPSVKADDFISDGRPIAAVRWWGCYITETNQRPDSTGFTAGPFDVGFYLSNLSPHPNSLPGQMLQLYQNIYAQETYVGIDQNSNFVYRYDAYLPADFDETSNTEYFIEIDKPTGEHWGWHMTPILTNDWAALGATLNGPWQSLSNDSMAFELMTVPEPSSLTLVAVGVPSLWLAIAGVLGVRFCRKRRVQW